MSEKEEQKNDKLIGMKAICEHMGISESTVIKWRQEFDMPIEKKGGTWCGSKQKLDVWFDENMAA